MTETHSPLGLMKMIQSLLAVKPQAGLLRYVNCFIISAGRIAIRNIHSNATKSRIHLSSIGLNVIQLNYNKEEQYS